MLRRTVLKGMAAATATSVFAPAVFAQKALKIGISMPMTGPGFGTVGPQLKAGIQLYMQQHGDVVADRKIEIIIRDDAGVADTARRVIQEMIANDRVDVCVIGITPTALAIAQLVTQAKKATLVMTSGASVFATRSPYFVRPSFLLNPQAWIIAEWAAKNGSKNVITLVNEWATGVEAETAFKTRFMQVGGTVVNPFEFPSLILTSRHSCSASPIGSPTRHSFIFQDRRQQFSPNSSVSVGWPSRASRSSGLAILRSTTASTTWAIR